jgi:hypothetical protein
VQRILQAHQWRDSQRRRTARPIRETGASAILIGRQERLDSQASLDRRRFAAGPGSSENRECGMMRAVEENRENMGEEDGTLSRRDRQQARSFAVGGYWSKWVPNECALQSYSSATRGLVLYIPCPRVTFQESATHSPLTHTLPRHFAPAPALLELSVLLHLISSIHLKSRAPSERKLLSPSSRLVLFAFVSLHLPSRGHRLNTTKLRKSCRCP